MSDPDRLQKLERDVAQFAADRDWEQFHSPKNLSMAIAGEAGELIAHFQWLTQDESRRLEPRQLEAVGAEMADVYIYLIRLAQQLDLDLIDEAAKKVELNMMRYPADRARGSARKYTEYASD